MLFVAHCLWHTGQFETYRQMHLMPPSCVTLSALARFLDRRVFVYNENQGKPRSRFSHPACSF
uniref:Uncharacterized protein n=1 Tax=Anguilla anguilla TaxID=7936 RepID=A0A0E9T3L2_ANGAN